MIHPHHHLPPLPTSVSAGRDCPRPQPTLCGPNPSLPNADGTYNDVPAPPVAASRPPAKGKAAPAAKGKPAAAGKASAPTLATSGSKPAAAAPADAARRGAPPPP